MTILSRSIAVLLLSLSAAAQGVHYDVLDLGLVPGQSPIGGVPVDGISPSGEWFCGGSWDPYSWSLTGGMRRMALPAGQRAGFVAAINDAGLAVGHAGLSAVPYYRAGMWDPTGAFTSLHLGSWVWSRAVAVNGRGEILLAAAVPNGTGAGEAHAFLRSPTGGLLDLTAGSTIAAAIDLDEAGRVLFADAAGYAVREADGTRIPIPNTFAPVALGHGGEVLGADQGDVALWRAGAGWQPVPDPQLSLTRFGGVNRFGQIVASHSVRTGQSPPSYTHYGYLHTPGLGWQRLDFGIDPSRSIQVKQFAGITDGGVIAGDGSIGPDNRAMRITTRHVTSSGLGCADGAGEEVRALVAGDVNPGGIAAFLGAGGPATGIGAFFVSAAPAQVPLPGGCTLRVDPAAGMAALWTTNVAGRSHSTAVIPAVLSGQVLHVQFGVLDPLAPNGMYALSNALRVAIP